MEGYHGTECDRASETSSFIEDEEEEEEAAVDPEEAEELTNSLKDLIQSEDVKPKLQYIMTNPSFSMVTVQSEDSGITWETSSSRCSTPWVSETSTTSDLYSMESSPVGSPPGKVIFSMDEGKIVRKRKSKSSNRVLMPTNLKGGQGNKKRDSSGMQRQEPRTVLGEVQGSVLNVEQMEAQDDTDEEMLDDKEDLETIAEEPVKRATIISIFRESRLRKVGLILGGPVQARIQLFNSIFGGTGPAPETLEKTRIQRSSSVSGDSEQFLEASVKERLQKFSSLSEATHPKPFQKARSRNLETPSERRREQRQQPAAHSNQSYSSPTMPLEKRLTNKDDVSFENVKPVKMKDKPNRFSSFGAETTLQREERKDRQSLLETLNQVSGQSLKSCPPEEARKQQSYSPAAKTAITEQSTSVSLESDDKSEKQVLLPSVETANKKPDQSLLTASDPLDELMEQEIQPNSALQSVSADFVNELDRQSTQPILPTASMSEHPEREAQKSAVQSYLPSAPSTKSKYSTLSETRQENIPQSSETAKSESEHVLLPHSVYETEKQETECHSSTTAWSETEHSGLLHSAKKKESQKTPPPETQNVHLEKQTESERDFSSSLQETEEQGIKLNSPIPEKTDSKYFGISYPICTETQETQKTSAVNKAVDLDHPDFSIEKNKQAESAQMEMERPDFSYSREETEESESAQLETEYPELLFSMKETEELESAHLETEQPDFSYSMEKTEEFESAQLEMEHPDFSFSREETEELESAQLETEHQEFLFSREETEELESAQLETEHQEFLFSREETEKQKSVPFELEQPESYSPEEAEQEETAQLALEPSDLSCLMEEAEKENTTELQLVHPDMSDSTGRAETQQTGYLETAHSDLPYPMNKTKQQELAQVDLDNSIMSYFSDKGEQPQPVQQDSQPGGKLYSRAKGVQGETTQLQSEHPVLSYSTGKEQQHKTSQMRVEQLDTSYSTGKTEQQEILQPKLEQADSPYSHGETAQQAVQKDLEGPEPSCFISEAEQHENVQLASENRDFSFTTGEVMQERVESGSLGSSHLIDRAKPREMAQLEQEHLLPSYSTAGSQQQEATPLDLAQPDISYSFGRMEQQDIVQRELEQQETAQQKAMQMELEYSDLSETRGKEEPQDIIDQMNLAQQETAQPELVHPSLPYSFSEQIQKEMQMEPAYPEWTFYVSTEMQKKMTQHKSEQPFLSYFTGKTEQQEIVCSELEQTFLPSSSGKEAPLEMEMSSEYPDLSCSFHEAEQQEKLEHPTLPFSLKQQETAPLVMEHPDFSCDSGEAKPGNTVEQESEHPELSYSMGETRESEHLDSPGTLGEAAQNESMEVESKYPNLSCSDGQKNQQETSQLDSKYPDLSFFFGKAKEQATQEFEPKHQKLPEVARKRASQATAQIESKHLDLIYSLGKADELEIAPWEMKHPDLSHSTDETNQQEVVLLDQKHRKISVDREKQQQTTNQQLEKEKLSYSPGKTEQLKYAQEDLEQLDLSFSIDRPDDEMAPPETEHADVIYPLDKAEVRRRVRQESEQTGLTSPFGKAEQKTVQPDVEIPHLAHSVGTTEQKEMAEPGQGHPDLPYSVFKAGGLQTAQLKPEYPGLACSLDKVQETTQLRLEQLDVLYVHDKTEQLPPAQLELGHTDLASPADKVGQQGMEHTALGYPDEGQSVSRAEYPQSTKEKLGLPDASSYNGKAEQREMAKLELKHPDLSYSIDKTQPRLHSTGTVQQQEKVQPELEQPGDFSSSLGKEEQWESAGMQAEHPELQCSMGKTERLQNSQAKSEYVDLSFSVGTAETHKTTQPQLKEHDLLHSFVKTKQSWAAPLESEHPDISDAMGKVLHPDLSSSVSEEKRSAQLEFKQERGSYALHPEETARLKLEWLMLSSSHGTAEQPNRAPLEGEFPDFLYSSGLSLSLGKTEKQETAQAGFMPSDFSYSTGKAEQLQMERLKSKRPDLSYSLGEAETRGIKPPGLLYSYGKAEQPQAAQLEHPEMSYFADEMEREDGAQPELQCVNLQYSVVETELPETPSVSYTVGRIEEQETAQLDFEQSDLSSSTDKAEKHETALLRAGRSEKQDTGATSSLTAQLETEQQDLSFSTEEAESQKMKPYSSLPEQTVSVPLGISHSVSATKTEGSPKSSPVTGGLSPKHLDLSYTHCKTEQSETAQPASGFFFARKAAENTNVHPHLPVAAQSEAEHVILPETEREQTPHYFHTATQLESEQLNLSYSIDKAETLESQDYLTVPSKLESEPSDPFYSVDETCQQEIPPYSKPASQYLVPTWSLAEQEKQSMQLLIPQSAQSECKHVIPPHDEKELQKIQLYSPKPASLKTVQLESISLTCTQDQDEQESQDHLLDTEYLSSEQLRSPPQFTTEQDKQEMQPDVQKVPRLVTTESKVTAVADRQAVLSDSFVPFHTLPEMSVSVAFTDDEEKQNIPSSLSDVVGMLGKQSNVVSDIYTEGEDRHEMQPYFAEQKHTSLEHLGAVSSDLVYETVTHQTQHYSGEWSSLSSAEMKSVCSSSDEKQNPDIPSFGLASWLAEEVKACSISPIRATEVDKQGIQLSPNEASDFGSKQFPAGSCTELTVHGTTKNKGDMFRVSDSVSSEISHRMSSETSHRAQRYDLPSLGGDNPGPDKTSIGNPTKMEAMQHLEVDKVSEVPEHYLRREEEEMEHVSAVEDSQHAPEPTEQKDLFNIISEGYEILSIHAPTHISSVDQEESKHMPDKLEYLETNPSFKSKLADDGHRALASGTTTEISESSVLGKPASHELKELVKNDDDVEETEETQQENSMLPENNNNAVLDPNNGMADTDYFEKYTLIDDKSPIKPHFERPSSLFPVIEDPNEPVEEATSFKESAEVDTLEEEFSLLEDLDEVFYGTVKGESKIQSYADAPKPLPLQKSIDISSKKVTNVEDEQKSLGTPLFDSEGVLERSLLFPTTVAAVNPELLEEPPALSFLYKDLYAEAVGKKTKDETPSDEESGNSNVSFPSRNSDTDDGMGIYFEKYILKDEIPSKAIGPQKDQIPEDESFSGGISVQSSEDKHKQGSGDVSRVRTEILQERGVVEREKVQVDSDIQATICKPMHSIPFGSKVILSGARSDTTEQREEENVPVETTEELPEQSSHQEYSQLVDYQGAAYQEAGNKQEEQHEITAVPQMEKYVPYVRTPVEDSEDDQYTQENLSHVPTIQQTEKPDLQREEQHPDVYEDLAESMDYDVITQEELLQDVISEFTHEELLFEDRDSFEHVGDSYEFDNEQRTPVELEDSGFVVMYPEKSATNIPQVESPQRELKKAQADTYCYHCKCPISAIDKLFGEHKDHEVTTLDAAATKMKDQLGELLIALEEKSMKIEEFVSDIESLFNSVEENCKKNAELLEKQNEEMLKKVVAQYDQKSENFEEVKKVKMEYLYEQIVNFQQTVDSAKETLETTAKEMEELDGFVFLNSSKELNKRLLSAMDTTLSLEKVPSAFSLFEHYVDSPGKSNQHSLKHTAVPQTPTVIPQEPNSATSTSIAVYWAVNNGDTIDCFQVYCMEEPQTSKDVGALVEEYRVTVKESHCILEDLEPDRCYSVWVMAVNCTGCSLPSEKAIFKTAPAVPTIKAEDCTVCWDTATIRWRASLAAMESFTLEYCRQHSLEGEGLRSFASIKRPELKVSLEPNVTYFFYLRAVNPFGTSEQSEAALISTKGTRFRLLSDTAHPALQISPDATVIRLPEKAKFTGFPSILGELLPARGCHYWETVVSACRSYRIGICYEATSQSSVLGLSDTSWCMRCCPTQTSFLYRFLHIDVMSDVHVTEHPARIGILLDYSDGRLLFFNAERGLVLFAIRHKFTDAAHPTFALEKAGTLTLRTGMELPEFVKHS
ncbi:LOW QUALITY PROTEIN: cardiomyopathy-associated protein 5-like [Gymnogyps californianus]|uniref:LOW QUALITY PROTEIN: cardiomyopathy-associated protein 5-like n=1 Tax=Gymnogyps californianus TaxID=33616 RepID=UPI0021CA60DB|nr:LOW QUALITY PROTEIN: cardiomyopathy-associated protein 5-like [Gymnogyps californianus]